MAGVVETKAFRPLGRIIIVISAFIVQEVFSWKLFERPVPEIEKRFAKTLTSNDPISVGQWDDFLQSDKFIEIPSNTEATVELQSEVLITGFLQPVCYAGPGTQIEFICSEFYTRPPKPPASGSVGTPRWKGDRADFVNGKLYGPEDVYITTDGHNVYESFWFRPFRFIRLKI
jgi:hypothetical protein